MIFCETGKTNMLKMNTYNSLKGELLKTSKNISGLISNAKSIPGMPDHSFHAWEKTNIGVNKQLSEEMIRVAVVGPIKSGKSTFINSLFKGEYLKRGAGVITSIVTRARSSDKLRARLLFKSWDEINADMAQALVLFPTLEWRTEKDVFEIRQKKERMDLQKALDSLSSDHLVANGARNADNILLSSYLKGYEKVKAMISSEVNKKEYENDEFSEHWNFVGDGSMSVYLKDIQLEIDSGDIESNIEIADCQGSDSPNPLHLAMIQDYLLLTNLIIYVISSRTGIREADIKFLSIIKKMGIMDNILFVVNCDFSEHESIGDLKALIESVKEDLLMIRPSPEIYSMSALYNLFKAQHLHLSQKDRLRLAQWEKEKEIVSFSDAETERFEISFYDKLSRGSYALLLKNHLERLHVISSGIGRWIFVNQNILTKDSDSANKVIEHIKKHRMRMDQIKSVIKGTLDGSMQQINRKLRTDIDRYFDARSGNVIRELVEFIKNFTIPYPKYEEQIKTSGFSNTLYRVYQEFKLALDTFMAETVNPEIIRFVRSKEEQIHGDLMAIADPFDVMVHDAIVEYNSMMGNLGINPFYETRKSVDLPDISAIKTATGLTLPPVVAHMRYTARMKTEATMRFGLYKVINIFKKILKKPIQGSNEGEILALKDGVLCMKRETERSIISHFKDYQENIKFQYTYKLVEALSNSLYESLLDRFEIYTSDLSNLVSQINNKMIDREQMAELLKMMALSCNETDEKINDIREKIESLRPIEI
jgi:GTPase SAR1 family protein